MLTPCDALPEDARGRILLVLRLFPRGTPGAFGGSCLRGGAEYGGARLGLRCELGNDQGPVAPPGVPVAWVTAVLSHKTTLRVDLVAGGALRCHQPLGELALCHLRGVDSAPCHPCGSPTSGGFLAQAGGRAPSSPGLLSLRALGVVVALHAHLGECPGHRVTLRPPRRRLGDSGGRMLEFSIYNFLFLNFKP